MDNFSSSLAVKYRPQSFDDGFYGQPVTATILKKLIENKKFKNVMLFSGASGCGKTTAARIVSKLINNGIGDPIEVDAASNNGVDQVREIIDESTKRSLVGEYKIFIIDECHMITTQGWNSFLKCIEECPKYTIFIFCTTDPQKIPKTVLNRMQRFNFSAIEPKLIYEKLIFIAKQEGFTNYEQTCDLISRTSNGCMREAISRLEKCADFSSDLCLENSKLILNGLSFETMFKLTWALQEKNSKELISTIDSIYSCGNGVKAFIDTYLEFILDLVKYSLFNNIDVTNIPGYLATENNAVVQYTVSKVENAVEYFNNLLQWLFKIKSSIKYDSNSKNSIIVMLLNFIN